jgi:P27 family predicted phage terminase small subunit
MRGRKPKPTALKVLRGDQPDRINLAEPKTIPGRPACPEFLDAVARSKWDEMVSRLEAMGVLSQSDGEALALYCLLHSHVVEAEKQIAAHGLTERSKVGGDRVSAHFRVLREATSQMTRLLVEFGCTPSSRGRIKMGGEKKDELAEFLDGRKAR